jgi:hypothetical protein
MSGHRLFQDDLPTSPTISRLRASGVVTAEKRSVIVTFGEGESALAREVRVTHQIFPSGGSWSFFVCPACGRPARVLKLHEKAMCRRCCLQRRDWISRIERLAGRARRSPASPAPEAARVARRRAGEIASEVRPPAGPPMVAHRFVAERNDPRAPGSAATAPSWA